MDCFSLRVCRRVERTKEGSLKDVSKVGTSKGRRIIESDWNEQAEKSQAGWGRNAAGVIFKRDLDTVMGMTLDLEFSGNRGNEAAAVSAIHPRRGDSW